MAPPLGQRIMVEETDTCMPTPCHCRRVTAKNKSSLFRLPLDLPVRAIVSFRSVYTLQYDKYSVLNSAQVFN